MSVAEFVAFDVETANPSRGSVCAIGYAVVERGQVVSRESWLSQPPADLAYFDPFLTSIHGIREQDCAGAPHFDDSLARLLKVVDSRPVVAHNAAFDIGALREGCTSSGLDWPELTYGCSLVMSRRSLGLFSHRLPIVCDHLGIELTEHHDPGADSEACARIVLALADKHEVANLDDLATSLQVRLGRLSRQNWLGCFLGDELRKRPPGGNPDADPNHPLYGQVVAFTGALSVTRAEAWALLASAGGVPAANVTKESDFLVIGDGFTGDDPAEFHTGKALKDTKWRAKGRTIEVLTEGDLWALLDDATTVLARDRANPAQG